MTNPLQQFAPLLDKDFMAAALQRHLPECVAGHWQILDCRIQHPRYKTYRSPENLGKSFLSLVYQVQGRDPVSALIEHRLIYARAFLGKLSQLRFEQAQIHNQSDSLIHVAELGLVGWRFPDDPAMPWLTDVLNAPHIGDSSTPITAIEIINYRPETRCTARYQIQAADSSVIETVYGKTYVDNRGWAIYQNLLSLQAQTAKSFVLPQALGYDLEHQTLWLQALPGEALSKALLAPQPVLPVDTLVKALAGFHRLKLLDLQTITAKQQLQEWQKKAGTLSYAYPEITKPLQALLSYLQSNCPTVQALSLIHGDFHIDQLAIMPNGCLALFDYDELALGSPLQDLANFAADLYNYPLAIAQLDKWVIELFAAYSAASLQPVTDIEFLWHLRGQLLTRAYRSHIQQKPDTARCVADFITLALRPWPTANQEFPDHDAYK